MNDEIDLVHIGELDDIDVGSVESLNMMKKIMLFFNLESGFFSTQGHCNCEEKAFLSEATVENWNALVVGIHIASF